MLRFNNNHIFTGYLKQLLADFNLPNYRVYTAEQAEYRRLHNKEKDVVTTVVRTPNEDSEVVNKNMQYATYIKDDKLYRYVKYENEEPAWYPCWTANVTPERVLDPEFHEHVYFYNKKGLNTTKNLKIQNNIYDSYTHEYLGNYLRFQRDYLNLDLMPLYNCFSNRLATNTNLCGGKFNTKDTNYKIYVLPVKLFKEYTIAIDCESTVEMCCGIFNKYQDTSTFANDLATKTYFKTSNIKFAKPFIFNRLTEDEIKKRFDSTSEALNFIQEAAQKEPDLRLFIKLPVKNNSSITVLEGNYIGWNDHIKNDGSGIGFHGNPECKTKEPAFNLIHNRHVTNFEEPAAYDIFHFKPITNLQLLQINTGNSYPFADRLIEYLIGNVINNEDYIRDDIRRVQKVMSGNGIGSLVDGAWENKIRPVMYDYINKHRPTNIQTVNHDLLGYVDKEAERFYSSDGTQSISKVDLYKEEVNSVL